MFRGQYTIRCAKERIRPRRKDGKGLVAALDWEGYRRPLRAANPVALHLFQALRPIQRIQISQQPLGVGGNLEHPLAHGAALDRVAGLDIFAILDLFVGEHRAQRWAPVDRHFGDIGQPFFKELEKDPLGPAVIGRQRGIDLAVPVIGEPQPLQLAAKGGNIALGDHRGMDAGPISGALGGQAKGIPAHWVQHVVALHAPHPCDHIGGGVTLGVADMQTVTGGIGKHIEHIKFGLVAQFGTGRRTKDGMIGPGLLPLGLNRLWIVGVRHRSILALVTR